MQSTVPEKLTVYVVLHSAADADKGFFQSSSSMGGYTDRERARERLRTLVKEEEAQMVIPFNMEDFREEYSSDHWEVWQDGYAAGWFIRYEIVPVECEVRP